MRIRRTTGFTLVELLVVIGIIVVLAAIVITALSVAREKARDATRIADVRAIATALDFYYDSMGHYPIATGTVSECGHAGNWIPDGTNYNWSTPYLPTVPRDPAENCSSTPQQGYTYTSDGTTYQLTTTLENGEPPSGSGGTYVFNGTSFQPFVDNSPITVDISSPDNNPTNQSPIPLTITFSRAVSNFTEGMVSVTFGVVSGFSEALATVYNLFVTPTDNNTLIVTINGGTVHDQNGVSNAPATFTITYDSLLPHTALSPDPLPSTISAPFTVSVNFTVAVVDFTASKVSVQDGTVSSFTKQDGSDYTFSVSPSSAGTVIISVPGGVVHSEAGNGNVASNVITTTYAP